MLEGIREGVQGVSRLIAAGLGEFSAAPAPSSPSPALTSRQPAAKRRHLTRPSSSSISTYATNASNSARLSHSSASSLDDEPELEGEDGLGEREDVGGEEKAVMMVDTGAKQTTSACLEQKHSSWSSETNFDINSKDRTISTSSSPIASEKATKIHRRKSRDCSSPLSSKSFDLSTTCPPTSSPSAKRKLKAKRASFNALPPVASIPALGSLTAVGGGGGQPVASWMEKKWEELQSGSTYVFSTSNITPLY